MKDRIKTFFKEVYTEAKKVDWPTKQETLRYTMITIGISLGVAFVLGLLDLIFVRLLGLFII